MKTFIDSINKLWAMWTHSWRRIRMCCGKNITGRRYSADRYRQLGTSFKPRDRAWQ